MREMERETLIANSIEISGDAGSGRTQWIHLLPAGTMETQDARGPFHARDLPSIIRNSLAVARGGKIAVDFNHAIDLGSATGAPTPAAGWIGKLEARSDGIWGLVEWTPNAASMVRDKEYRFISPVIRFQPDKSVTAIIRASLTNNPNLTLTALNQAQAGGSMDNEELLSELRNILALDAEASQADVVAAVKKLATSVNSIDPAKFVSVEMFQQTVAELNRLRDGVSLQEAERIVENEIRTGGLLPFMRDWAISLCQSNKGAYDEFIAGAGKPVREFCMTLTSPGMPSQGEMNGRQSSENMDGGLLGQLGLTKDDVKTYGGKGN